MNTTRKGKGVGGGMRCWWRLYRTSTANDPIVWPNMWCLNATARNWSVRDVRYALFFLVCGGNGADWPAGTRTIQSQWGQPPPGGTERIGVDGPAEARSEAT